MDRGGAFTESILPQGLTPQEVGRLVTVRPVGPVYFGGRDPSCGRTPRKCDYRDISRSDDGQPHAHLASRGRNVISEERLSRIPGHDPRPSSGTRLAAGELQAFGLEAPEVGRVLRGQCGLFAPLGRRPTGVHPPVARDVPPPGRRSSVRTGSGGTWACEGEAEARIARRSASDFDTSQRRASSSSARTVSQVEGVGGLDDGSGHRGGVGPYPKAVNLLPSRYSMTRKSTPSSQVNQTAAS